MKRLIFCATVVVAFAVWAFVQAPSAQPSLAGFVPQGPVLVLEAKDLQLLLQDWNASREKKTWLASANYQAFSRSRLFLRLADAQTEFENAAGLPPNMDLLNSVAGTESMFAIYDIGNLQFLYITKLSSARALETALWKTRSTYETRSVAGQSYFVRTDPASHRVAAFGAAKDYLVVATREDLIAGALALIAGQPGATVTSERWYAESLRAAGAAGDLRMVMNVAELVKSPYFRSYWVQRNVSEIRQFGAAICDLHRGTDEYREERVLLRFDQPEQTAAPLPDVSGAMAEAGLHRAWSKPTPSAVIEMLRSKVLAPGPSAPPASQVAPGEVSSGLAGSEDDLETRIDEAPLTVTDATAVPESVRKLIESAPMESMLNVSTSRNVPGGVFVNLDTAVVLLASSDWNASAVQAAFSYGPLGRVSAHTQGRILVVSTSDEMARKVAAALQSPQQAAKGATYTALFHHTSERPRFRKMMRLLDHVSSPREDGAEGEPAFFSQNVGSLSATLARVDTAAILARDSGPALFETVTYRLSK